MDITIIANNGGGLTLQLSKGGQQYQHSYDDAGQCARDIRDAYDDDNFYGWAGNELEDDGVEWLIPTDDQLRNGGYRVLTVGDLLSEACLGSSWRNIRELAHEFNAL